MDQTKQQHPNSMTLGSAKVELFMDGIEILDSPDGSKDWQFKGAALDVGLLRGLTITPTATQIEVLADNGTVLLEGQSGLTEDIAFSLLERHLPLMGQIFKGIADYRVIMGAPVEHTEETAVSAITDGIVPLAEQNADGTSPVVTNVTVDGTALTGDDYMIVARDGGFAVEIGPELLADAVTVIITYSTAAASGYRLDKGTGGTSPGIGIRITNKRKADNGKIIYRTWEFPYCAYSGTDTRTFKSGNEADSVMEIPIQYTAKAHPDMVDDDELTRSCVVRETQETA
jgi:hypothetical protein